MGAFSNIRDRVTDATRGLVQSFGPDFGALNANEASVDETTAIKSRLLNDVRERAKANGQKYPTLEDYRQACVAFGETKDGKALGNKWSAKSYSNLNGQDLSGFKLSDPKVGMAKNERDTTNLLDQDSDGTINDFYTNVSLFEANLNNSYIDPATSFNEEVAKAKQLNNMTFNGMVEGETFTFGAGEYTNARITGVDGGQIVFGKGSVVDGIEFEGKSAKVKVESGARIEHIKADRHFSIIKFDTEPGSMITNSDLTSVTVSMASKLEGCEFKNVRFGPSLEGLEFKKGCSLKNVSVNGKAIEDPAELKKYGAEVDDSVTAQVSPDFRKQCAMEMIRKTERGLLDAGAVLSGAERFRTPIDLGALNEAPAPAQAPAAAPVAEVAAPVAAQGPSDILAAISAAFANNGVSGGERTTLADAALGNNRGAFETAKVVQPDQGMSLTPKA